MWRLQEGLWWGLEAQGVWVLWGTASGLGDPRSIPRQTGWLWGDWGWWHTLPFSCSTQSFQIAATYSRGWFQPAPSHRTHLWQSRYFHVCLCSTVLILVHNVKDSRYSFSVQEYWEAHCFWHRVLTASSCPSVTVVQLKQSELVRAGTGLVMSQRFLCNRFAPWVCKIESVCWLSRK